MDPRHLSTFLSSFSHSLLFAAGHFPLQCSDFLLGGGDSCCLEVLWGDSGSGSSSVSQGSVASATVTGVPAAIFECRFTWSLLRQAIRPLRFLQTLQIQTAFVFHCSFALVITSSSVRLGCPFSFPLGHPWGITVVPYSYNICQPLNMVETLVKITVIMTSVKAIIKFRTWLFLAFFFFLSLNE